MSDVSTHPVRSGGEGRGAPGARGLTLLETVLASVLLALVAVFIANTLTMIARFQADDLQRLGAYELANRKILEHLDDKNSVGDPAKPQELYGFRYRWRLADEPVRMTVKATESSVRAAAQLNPERFRRITVQVWLDESRLHPGWQPVDGEEMATLTRVKDPFGVLFRNPDSRNAFINKDPGAILGLFDSGSLQIPTGAGTPAGGAAGSARPGVGSGAAGGKSR
jgi:type II secretory pathway pseudopilin PulG